MENQTRFNLKDSIENWQQELTAQASLTAEVRRELETHLRDAIAGFQQQGLNGEESFWLARRRIGQPQQLSEEFVKANPAAVWRERVFWMAFGIMVFWQLTLFISYLEGIALFTLTPGLRGFYQMFWGLLGGLPVLFIGVMMARGWPGSKPTWFLQSRFRLAAGMLLLPILCDLTQSEFIRLQNLEAGRDVAMTFAAMGYRFFKLLLSYLQFSAAPLMLLIWFLPRQNRKAPKHA